MILVECDENAAPTRHLLAALTRLTPHTYATTGQALVDASLGEHAVLRITPHPDHDECGFEGTHATYTLRWSIPALCQFETTGPAPACHTCRAYEPYDLPPDQVITQRVPEHLWWHDLTEPASLRAAVIPAAERLAAAPTLALEGMDERHVALIGGPDNARRLLADRQHVAITSDCSAEVYRWDELAVTITDLHQQEVRALTPLERVMQGGAHLYQLLLRQAHTREGLARRMRNAQGAGATVVELQRYGGVSRPTVYTYLGAVQNRPASPAGQHTNHEENA
ncbi:hypothetical protein AB0395_22150 [Streptosporangium sp. NPDC051023]|uniref:hypothetical protein n=1 Tax=Streptosporangium sp. NPDC051023 TaxID=3155410 RepID=UPI00344B9C45